MNILLIGLGSIGKRHLRNILTLGYQNISVVSRSGNLPAEFKALPVYTGIEQALNAATFTTAILCTPTAFHAADMLILLKARVQNIYLEKPVSHSLQNVDEILQLAAANKTNIVVGFDLHFDLGLQKVKELLDNNTIGKIVSVNAQVGQFLPGWRPHEDYRFGMSARKKTGGGVMLDLIHEFDYLLWLLGPVQQVACLYNNSGALQIETEDVAEVLLRFEQNILGTIHLDYLQQKLVRNCRFTGYEGSIYWDLAACKVWWINGSKEEFTFEYKGYERNERFIQIMKSFLGGVNDARLTSLSKGIESLRLVLAAKHSSETNNFITVKSVAN